MEPLENKLLLTREVERLQLLERQLNVKIKKLEGEQLELLDLKVKLEKEITALNEKKSFILKEIQEDKDSWNLYRGAEQEALKEDKLEVKKILNRESFIVSQEIENKKRTEEIGLRENTVGEREKVLKEGLDFLQREKKQANIYVATQQKIVDELKVKVNVIKEEALDKINRL